VKLQLADVNKNELEAHLAELSCQLELTIRRSAMFENRCRDQAIEIESLQVEVSSLRAATSKMHLHALETLPLVEKLEYEHKKHALKNDFMNQLRDFQEREEQAIIRQKARIRAQYEKQLEEFLLASEKKQTIRLEQEENVYLKKRNQIRHQFDLDIQQLKKQIKEEIYTKEKELQEAKDQHFTFLSNAIRKEEEELNHRWHETKQLKREEELVLQAQVQQQNSHVSSSSSSSCFKSISQHSTSKQQQPLSSSSSARLEFILDEKEEEKKKMKDEEEEEEEDSQNQGYLTDSPVKIRDIQHFSKQSFQNKKQHKRTKKKQTQREQKERLKWTRRVEDEKKLLSKAKLLVNTQKKDLKKQAEKIKKEKKEWLRDSRKIGSNNTNSKQNYAILEEMKRMIDQNTISWNKSVKQLRQTENWISKRQKKILAMEKAVSALFYGNKLFDSSSILDEDIDNDGPQRYQFAEEDEEETSEQRNNDEQDEQRDDDNDDNDDFALLENQSQSDVESILETLERLDGALVSDVSDLSEKLRLKPQKRKHFSKMPQSSSDDQEQNFYGAEAYPEMNHPVPQPLRYSPFFGGYGAVGPMPSPRVMLHPEMDYYHPAMGGGFDFYPYLSTTKWMRTIGTSPANR
jgi:hypothetical protein